MLVKLAKQAYTIESHGVLSGVLEQPQLLQVCRGRVWLTVEGSTEDYWLSAGDVSVLPAGKLLVLEAEQQAAVVQIKTSHSAKPLPSRALWTNLAAA